MDSYKNEIFGPVLEVVRVPTYADAVRLINENPYGNGPPSSPATAARPGNSNSRPRPGWLASTCRSGAGRLLQLRGWKSSLFGDLHMYGPEGIQFYTRAKVVTSRWPDPGTSKVDLGFPRTR